MRKEPITIKDIASILNVSISTVSRALRGAPEVNSKTRKTVQEMARKLNYEPNLVAQSLRSNKTKTLGIIVPDLVTHFFASILSGIQDVAAKKGYNIMICQSNESAKTEMDNIHTLVASRVDGLLISMAKETSNHAHLHSLYSRGIPLVFFDRICEELETSKITVDDHDGAFKATEHLIEMGCRRIAHLSGPEKLTISENRLQGYLDALKKYNIPIDEALIRPSGFTKNDHVIDQTQALLDLPNPPDGLFAVNDAVAIQAMLLMKKRGVRIPEDIAVVGFNNSPETVIIEPSLTTVEQPSYKIGQIAAKHVLEQINQPEDYSPQTITLKTELIIRDSSRKKMSTVNSSMDL